MELQRYPLLPVRAAVAAVLAAFMASQATSVSAAEVEKPMKGFPEVTVTGSAYRASGFHDANSPLVSVGNEELEQRSSPNIESYLNQLPAFNPSSAPERQARATPTFRSRPVNTPGIASVSLRGFGPNRSLVLIDGRRAVPVNPLDGRGPQRNSLLDDLSGWRSSPAAPRRPTVRTRWRCLELPAAA